MTRRAAALLATVALLGGCSTAVRYSDDLVSAKSGRTLFTRAPAAIGGIVGFLVGVPLDVVALPATYLVYKSQPAATRDPLSTFLFPSFVLWRVGTLFAAPVDAVEWGVWRWWQPEESLTPEEQERIEAELDALHQQWTDYPVEWIHPRSPGR